MTARAARVPLLTPSRAVTIRRLEDPLQVRSRLLVAPAVAAYGLAYLDASRFGQAAFFEASHGQAWGLVMHAHGGLGPSTLLLGDPELVEATLRLHPGPRHALLMCSPDHVDKALQTYHLWRPQSMVRMQLDPAAFAPPRQVANVRRLLATDAAELNRLYALEGDGIWYSGRQVANGLYFGAYVRGRLVAAAGTHIHSRPEGVGVVGNVFTHPDFRNHGLGAAVTAAVTAELLNHCSLIVLSVDPANRVARQLYERLGYREAGRLVEAMFTRRNVFSPLPLFRRLAARWRGSERGVERVQA